MEGVIGERCDCHSHGERYCEMMDVPRAVGRPWDEGLVSKDWNEVKGCIYLGYMFFAG